VITGRPVFPFSVGLCGGCLLGLLAGSIPVKHSVPSDISTCNVPEFPYDAMSLGVVWLRLHDSQIHPVIYTKRRDGFYSLETPTGGRSSLLGGVRYLRQDITEYAQPPGMANDYFITRLLERISQDRCSLEFGQPGSDPMWPYKAAPDIPPADFRGPPRNWVNFPRTGNSYELKYLNQTPP
jgi:hypothetical protein